MRALVHCLLCGYCFLYCGSVDDPFIALSLYESERECRSLHCKSDNYHDDAPSPFFSSRYLRRISTPSCAFVLNIGHCP